MAKKLALTIRNRARAFVLLRQGHEPHTIADMLGQWHPRVTPEQIHAAYFPKKGTWSVWKTLLKIKSKKPDEFKREVGLAWSRASQKSRERSELSRQVINSLNQDETFTRNRNRATSKRSGALMRERFKNPEFAAAHSKRMSEQMKKLRTGVDFLRKREDGFQRFLHERQNARADHRENLYNLVIRTAIRAALDELHPEQKTAIEEWLQKPWKAPKTKVKEALTILKENAALENLYRERKKTEMING